MTKSIKKKDCAQSITAALNTVLNASHYPGVDSASKSYRRGELQTGGIDPGADEMHACRTGKSQVQRVVHICLFRRNGCHVLVTSVDTAEKKNRSSASCGVDMKSDCRVGITVHLFSPCFYIRICFVEMVL